MKAEPKMHWYCEPSIVQTSRNRAAYLLRAARSRKRGNVIKRENGKYLINDASLTIYTT